MTDCRDCKDWDGCSGQWYRDSEGNEDEWYSYREIQWCPHQVFWILKHREDFDCGRWPKPPRLLECDANKHARIIKEAAFCRPKRIIGEVRARLTIADCKDKARILKEQAINRENMAYLDDDVRDLLYYASGYGRRNTVFRVWNAMRRYRNDNKKKEYQHKHHYILDENNFGKCKHCPATKQFPVEKKLELRPSEIIAMENLGSIVNCDPGSPLNASVYGVELDKDY